MSSFNPFKESTTT
jgi:hypothetical protein